MMAMKVVHYGDVPAEDPGGETRGVLIRRVISGRDGAANFHLRVFEVAPEGHTPLHSHPWEHEIFFLAGEGEMVSEGGGTVVGPGTAAFVPAGELHQIRNRGEEALRFICVIPAHGG